MFLNKPSFGLNFPMIRNYGKNLESGSDPGSEKPRDFEDERKIYVVISVFSVPHNTKTSSYGSTQRTEWRLAI